LPQAGRDLFKFAAARRPAPRAAIEEPPPPPPVRRPAPPVLKLSGIAEDETPSGPVRTAILSGLGQLFLVKEGENVTARFRVVKISADVVELADLDEGT